MTELASAEAVFGSVSRGDDDALSDRDILLVDDDTQLLKRRGAALEVEGWSVACYTFARLNALVSYGALFIQHLKDEAEILRDVGARLRTTVDGFRPKTSYHADLVENSCLAGLAALRPDTRTGALWAADVLYVATRNFGVLHLAQKGIYLFAFSQVLEALVEERVITPDAAPHLLKLRLAKSLYRSGERISLRAAADFVQSAIEARPDPSFPGRSVGLEPVDILMRSKELSNASPAYHKLRNLERTYIALQAIDRGNISSEHLVSLARWIENRRTYAYIAGKLEHELIIEMKNARKVISRVGYNIRGLIHN